MGACDVILVTWAKCLILIGSQPFLLRSDWSGPSGALFTTAKLARTQGIVYRRIFAEVIVYIFPHWHTNYLLKEAVAAYTN